MLLIFIIISFKFTTFDWTQRCVDPFSWLEILVNLNLNIKTISRLKIDPLSKSHLILLPFGYSSNYTIVFNLILYKETEFERCQ